jgi:hypothetical protein
MREAEANPRAAATCNRCSAPQHPDAGNKVYRALVGAREGIRTRWAWAYVSASYNAGPFLALQASAMAY